VHGPQILHYDVAPANVVVDERGRAVLIDFHLAKQHLQGAMYLPSPGGRAAFMPISRLDDRPAPLCASRSLSGEHAAPPACSMAAASSVCVWQALGHVHGVHLHAAG
jgi:serine/threonine protein kinase